MNIFAYAIEHDLDVCAESTSMALARLRAAQASHSKKRSRTATMCSAPVQSCRTYAGSLHIGCRSTKSRLSTPTGKTLAFVRRKPRKNLEPPTIATATTFIIATAPTPIDRNIPSIAWKTEAFLRGPEARYGHDRQGTYRPQLCALGKSGLLLPESPFLFRSARASLLL